MRRPVASQPAAGSQTAIRSNRLNDVEAPAQPKFQHLTANRTRAAILGVFWASWTSLMPILSGFVVFLYSSHLLTPTEFGIFALANAIVALCNAISFYGFGEALIQNKQIEEVHLNTVMLLCVGGGVVVYGALILLSPALEYVFGEPRLIPVLSFMGIKIIFDMAAVVPNAMLARVMSFSKVARRTTIASVASAILSLVMLAMGYGIWALASSAITLSVLTWLVGQLSVPWRPKLQFSGKVLKDLWSYGIFASGSRLITSLNVDQIMLGALLGPAAIGIYSFARRIFQMMNDLISGALAQVSHALLSSVQSEEEKLREGFFMAAFLSSLISFPIFGGLASISGDVVVTLFGAHWQEGVFPLQMFCAVGFLSCIGVLQASLINSQGKTRWWMSYQLFKQVVVVVTVLITYRLGLNAFMIGFALVTWAAWPISVHLVLKLLKVKLSDYLAQFIAPAIATAGMAAVIALETHYLGMAEGYLRLIVLVASGAVTYAALALILMRKRLKQVVGRLRRR